MESPFLSFRGLPALSEFRRAALAKKIGAPDVRAGIVHYVALKEKATPEEQSALEKLLLGDSFENIADGQPKASNDKQVTYYISPRTGTISPGVQKQPTLPTSVAIRKSLSALKEHPS